jgi:predicted XRE-type DNA-binding protein
MLNINGTEYPTMEEIWKVSELSEEEIDAIKLKNDIIEKLINVREKQGLTQQALADLCKVKQPFIAKLEGGNTDPQISSLIKVLKPLGYRLAVVPDNERRYKNAD